MIKPRIIPTVKISNLLQSYNSHICNTFRILTTQH